MDRARWMTQPTRTVRGGCGEAERLGQPRERQPRRTVGRGVHIFVFVDDYLVVGDDAEAARLGGETLEQVLFEFGIANT